MSKNSKKYAWLNTREDSAKTIVAEAKREAPEFEAHYAKFKSKPRLVVMPHVPSLIILEQ
jgi:hypothetical protein